MSTPIECPMLDHLGIDVIPLLFITKKNEKAGSETPAVLLRDVPETYSTPLRSMGCHERTDGWLVEVTSRSEEYWSVIFGKTKTELKPPQKVIEPKKKEIHTLPNILANRILRLSHEEITRLVGEDNLVAAADIRQAHIDAKMGSILSKGSWSIIRHCAADIISHYPERVEVFEFAWSMIDRYSLASGPIPEALSIKRLLGRVVEAKGLPPGLRALMPEYLVFSKGVKQVAKVYWDHCKLLKGGKVGGPIETVSYEQPEFLANYILSMNPSDLQDKKVIESFDRRIEPLLDFVDSDKGWIDDIILPDDNLNETTSVTDRSNGVVQIDQSGSPLSVENVVTHLAELSELAGQRAPIASSASRDYLSLVVKQPLVLCGRLVFTMSESTLSIFEKFVNKESIIDILSRMEKVVLELANTPGSPPAIASYFYSLLYSPVRFSDQVFSLSLQGNSSLCAWWATGYSIDRVAINSSFFGIYESRGGSCHRIDDTEYHSAKEAGEVLSFWARRARVRQLKLSGSERWVNAYSTVFGTFVRLSREEFTSQADAAEAVDGDLQACLVSPNYPVLVRGGAPTTIATAVSRLSSAFARIFGNGFDVTLGGEFELLELNGSLECSYDGFVLGSVRPGNLINIFGEALYMHCEQRSSEATYAFIHDLEFEWVSPDLDISIEDDLIEALDQYGEDVCEHLGRIADDLIKDAIEEPGIESHGALKSLFDGSYEALPEHLREFLASVSLYSAQYGVRCSRTLLSYERRRLGLGNAQLFSYCVMQLVGLSMVWSGDKDTTICSGCYPGDNPAGDVLPELKTAFSSLECLLSLVHGVCSQGAGPGAQEIEQVQLFSQ